MPVGQRNGEARTRRLRICYNTPRHRVDDNGGNRVMRRWVAYAAVCAWGLVGSGMTTAQPDLDGDWRSIRHEDLPDRGPGVGLGDYAGIPLTDAARQFAESWDAARLTPLLAGLLDLLPWLEQWHDEVDPQFGVGMGRYFDDFVAEELRRHGLTREDLRDWTPPTRTRRRGRARSR